MTSWLGNNVCIPFEGNRSPVDSPYKGSVMRTLMISSLSAPARFPTNSRVIGDPMTLLWCHCIMTLKRTHFPTTLHFTSLHVSVHHSTAHHNPPRHYPSHYTITQFTTTLHFISSRFSSKHSTSLPFTTLLTTPQYTTPQINPSFNFTTLLITP